MKEDGEFPFRNTEKPRTVGLLFVVECINRPDRAPSFLCTVHIVQILKNIDTGTWYLDTDAAPIFLYSRYSRYSRYLSDKVHTIQLKF